MSINHHLLAKTTTDKILYNFKSAAWSSVNGTGVDFYRIGCNSNFPSPDAAFKDDTNKLTNLNRIHQLAPRLHATIPLMSRGGCDLSVENKLRFIENTQLNKKKTSQSIDRFVPQLDKIKMYQDPKNIIPEDSDSNWVRGGRSSRLIVKDSEISERCGTK